MAKNETRRLNPSSIAEDIEIHAALKDISGYTPANPAFAKTALDALRTALVAKQEAEAQAAAAYETARDELVAAQWDFHNGVLGAKAQVIAQYGPNSNEVQAMKLKKKTEYKSPKRKTTPKS